MFAAETSLSNSPLPPHLFTFDDDDDAGPLSVDWAPLELEFGPEVEKAQRSKAHSKELKPTGVATAAAFAAALSTPFKNGLGKFSSSPQSHSGEGWLLGTGIGSDLAAAMATARLELLPDGLKCGCGSGFA